MGERAGEEAGERVMIIKKFVLLIDILGFSEAVNNDEYERIQEVLSIITRRNREQESVDVFSFSDSVIICSDKIFLISQEATYLIVELLLKGFLVRGAIAWGDYYGSGNIGFGKPTIEASAAEKKEAKDSRVVLCESVVRDILRDDFIHSSANFNGMPIIRDDDGLFCLDWLLDVMVIADYRIPDIYLIVQDNIDKLFHRKHKALSKWIYMANYLNKGRQRYSQMYSQRILGGGDIFYNIPQIIIPNEAQSTAIRA